MLADADDELNRYCPECRKDMERRKCPSCGDVETGGIWIKPEDVKMVEGLLKQGLSIKDLKERGLIK